MIFSGAHVKAPQHLDHGPDVPRTDARLRALCGGRCRRPPTLEGVVGAPV